MRRTANSKLIGSSKDSIEQALCKVMQKARGCVTHGEHVGTALTAAGQAAIAQQLLQSQADNNAACNEGATPLHKAAFGGHTQIVQMILSAVGQPGGEPLGGQSLAQTVASLKGTIATKLTSCSTA